VSRNSCLRAGNFFSSHIVFSFRRDFLFGLQGEHQEILDCLADLCLGGEFLGLDVGFLFNLGIFIVELKFGCFLD
jgi:hypothetical protein